MSGSGSDSALGIDSISPWTAAHVAGIARQPLPSLPLITAADVRPILPDADVWDYWPVQLRDGRTAPIAGGSLWMFLTAPRLPDPALRHDVARIRLLFQSATGWHDCGDLLPPGLNPGSREWSGSAILEPPDARVVLFFTAAGRRGELQRTFEQRLFQCSGELHVGTGTVAIGNWSQPVESVSSDGVIYFAGRQAVAPPCLIKGFRDPFWFEDPADRRGYLLFTGSLASIEHDYAGAIGLAQARASDPGSGFTLLPPVLHAAGVVSEMERPHLIVHQGCYYLFWSSSHRVFAPRSPAPSGLYGMVSSALRGPYTPLNGTGLVLANPRAEPDQGYCWQVLPELEVTSFIDQWGMQGRTLSEHPELLRSHFGGTPAPAVRLSLQGATSRIVLRAHAAG